MEELLSKLSSYSLINNLLPGVLFCVLGEKITGLELIQADTITALFVYYFIGMVINRIGSIMIEPILKVVGWISFIEQHRYVTASQQDSLLPELSETNNLLRSLIAMVVCLLVLMLFFRIVFVWPIVLEYWAVVSMLLLLGLFLFSYRKQTAYIVKRVLVSEKKTS